MKNRITLVSPGLKEWQCLHQTFQVEVWEALEAFQVQMVDRRCSSGEGHYPLEGDHWTLVESQLVEALVLDNVFQNLTLGPQIMPRGACRGQGFHRGTQGSESTSTSRWHKIRGCLSIHRWSWGTKRPRARKLRSSAGHSWLCWGSRCSQACHSVCNKDDGDENDRDKAKFFKN